MVRVNAHRRDGLQLPHMMEDDVNSLKDSFYMCIKFHSRVPTQSKDINQLSGFFFTDLCTYIYCVVEARHEWYQLSKYHSKSINFSDFV